MSKERARRRAEREREAAVRAAARAAAAEREQRRRSRGEAVRSRVPTLLRPGPRVARPTGTLGERRRRQTRLFVVGLVALNLLVWVFLPGWPVRAMVAVVSLLTAPVLHTLLFRR